MLLLDKPYKHIAAFFILVVTYILTGLLGLTLAIPPGYATVFWPPSGFALAAVYLFGYRLGLGVFWGAFLTNIINAAGLSLIDIAPVIYINAIFIALGSTAQACLGAYLIKKWIGDSARLENFTQILKFSALAGPISCLVAATIGVSTLVLSGSVPLSHFPYTWANWYVGDVLGVLIFSPVLVMLFATGVSLKRKLLTALPMLVLFNVVIASFFLIRQADEASRVKEFQFNTAAIKEDLDHRLQEHFNILKAMQALYHSSNFVDSEEFEIFAENTINKETLMGGIGYAPLIVPGGLNNFLSEVEQNNILGFNLRAFSKEHDRKCNPFCTPLLYLYPDNVKKNALGLDISKHETRLDAIQGAIERGQLTVSDHVILANSKSKGFLSVVPIFKNGSQKYGIEGFVVGASSYKLLFENTLDNWHDLGIHLKLFDETSETNLLFNPHDHGADILQQEGNPFVYSYIEEVSGRKWRYVFFIDHEFSALQTNWNIWFSLLASLIFTFFTSVFLMAITGQTATVENIVDQKTKELGDNNSFMKMIMDSVPDLIFVKNRFSQLVQSNKSFRELYKEEDRSKLIGATGFENFPDTEVEIFQKQDALAFERGYTETFEPITDYKNNTRDYYMRKIAFKTESGSEYLLAIGRDLTQEQETLDRLQRSEERFRTSMENAPIGMSLIDMEQNWILYNQALTDMLGYDFQEFATVSIKDTTHPEDLTKDNAQIKQLLDGKIKNYSVEKRYRKKDGNYVWCLLTLALIRDEESNPLYFVAHSIDITDQKNAAQIQAQLAKIFDSAVIELYIFDHETLKFLDANKAALKNLGYTRKQLLSKTLEDIQIGFDKKAFLKKSDPIAKNRSKSLELDATFQRKDSSIYDVLLNLQDIDYQDKKAFMAIVLDITDRKEIENDLKRSNKELEEFAYAASHDLKAPLRHVALSADFLNHEYKDKLDDKAAEFLDIMLKSTKRMQNMIDSLLEYSRVGRQAKEDMEEINVAEVIQETLQTLGPAIQENKAKVHVDDFDFKIQGNRTLILQLFQNLLQNAIKYKKDDASPIISIHAEEKERFIEFSIEDNGIGIDPKHADNIFKVFQRLHHDETQYKGTGIGLAICQRIVELHDGKIWLDHEYTDGCKFIFKLSIVK